VCVYGDGGGGVTRGQPRHGGQAYPAAAAESELAEAQRLFIGVRPGGDLARVRALHASALALARAAIARPGACAVPSGPRQSRPQAAPVSAVTKCIVARSAEEVEDEEEQEEREQGAVAGRWLGCH
jgi:hypothetical protein